VVLKRESVSDSVEKLLLDRITSGVYRVGDRLPTERELSETLGVSRAGIREALNRLQRMGIIATVRGLGGGSFVQEVDSGFLAEALSLMFKMKGVTREELMEARFVLAPAVAGLAAQRATEEDIQAPDELWKAIDEGGWEAAHEATFAFHVRLTEACGNTILQAAMKPLLKLVEPVAHLARLAPRQKRAPTLRTRLEAVLGAVKARDPERARSAMVAYMERFGEELQALEIQPPWLASPD
jgi:DNA-binding FadR family transcriptional regulator